MPDAVRMPSRPLPAHCRVIKLNSADKQILFLIYGPRSIHINLIRVGPVQPGSLGRRLRLLRPDGGRLIRSTYEPSAPVAACRGLGDANGGHPLAEDQTDRRLAGG